MSRINERNDGALVVGVALDGAGWHPAAWREADSRAEELVSAAYWGDLLVAADRAGLDFATIDDSLRLPNPDPAGGIPERPRADRVAARLDALLVAAWAAPRTERIGILPVVTTTHTEPFHVGTALQTLDHISLGRAGWQVRVSASPAEAAAFGRKSAAELPELLAEAADATEVARRLWDSWQDDAIIRERATGRFLDRDRVHHIRFSSERFSVVGPSIVPRSPQGQPPVALLAHTPEVIALAAEVADAVFVTPDSASPAAGAARGLGAAETVALVREAERRVGRAAVPGGEPLRVIADLVVVLDTPAETGTERLDRLNRVAGEAFVGDASAAVGSAAEIADTIERWRAEGVDGVRLRPAAIPTDLDAIARDLLPELRRRGLVADPERSAPASLRERLGLAPAANRYEQEAVR